MGNFSRKVMKKKIRVCYGCLQCQEIKGMACACAGGTINPFENNTVEVNENDKKEKATTENESV